jgi:DnaJ homolog subfamily C member 19
MVEHQFDEPASPQADPETAHAEVMLGVSPDASEAEIRAALRAKLIETRAHPDHGGNAESTRRLIAARDLLLERVRERT